MAGSIFIPLISVFDGKGVAQAKGALAGLGSVAKTVKGNLTAMAVSFASVGVGNFIQESVVAARDLQAAGISTQSVFGDLSGEMQSFAKATKSIGLSNLEATQAINFMGTSLQGNGLTVDDAAEKTKNLISLSADLSATFGRDIPETLTAMGAVFRGEYDPIEKFGVAIKQAQVNALLMERGQNKLTGSAKAAAAAQARYDLMMQATLKLQGNYSKLSDTLFVKQNNLRASFENLKSSVGESLLAPLAKLAEAFIPIIDKSGPIIAKNFETLAKLLETLTPVIMPIVEIGGQLGEVFGELLDVLMSILEPILVPIVEVLKVLGGVVKLLKGPLIILAKVIAAVLVPALTVLGFVFTLVFKIIGMFIEGLASIPIVGDMFQSASKGLDAWTDGFNSLNDKLLETKSSTKDVTSALSHPGYKANAVDAITASTQKALDSAKKASDEMQKLIDAAKGTQKSIISAFDITGILKDNEQTISESVVYVNGKFRTVVSSVSKGSESIVNKFKANLQKLKTFYTSLNKLTELGLSPELRDQIIQAGPEAGQATAQAILASGKTGVKSLNKTFGNIKALAGNIGAKSAKAMATVGENIGNGLIDGLMSQRDNLLAVAEKLGKDLSDALDKGFNTTKPTTNKDKGIDVGYGSVADVLKLSQSGKLIYPNVFAGIGPKTLVKPSELTNPFAPQDPGFQQFLDTVQKANNYNVQIYVAPGTNPRDVNAALVKGIADYERTRGKY